MYKSCIIQLVFRKIANYGNTNVVKSWDGPKCLCNLCQTMLETNVDYG